MDIRCEHVDDALVARIGDQRIDAAVAIQFKDRMRSVMQTATGRVILDLSQVDFLDSSGLGAVVAVMKLAGPNLRLELAGLTPSVDRVFKLTRMDQFFTIHPRAPDGLQHVV